MPTKDYHELPALPSDESGMRVIGATRTYSREEVEQIARACHEENRSYCVSIGDDPQPAWEDAPDWQKDSAIKGVIAHLAVPGGLDPRQSHESWLAEKRATGWVYGPVKNPETKEHPCMVEYDQLPEEQQRKDAIFGATVERLR